MLAPYVTSWPIKLAPTQIPWLLPFRVLFVGKGHGVEEGTGRRNEKKLEKEGKKKKKEFLLLKSLNVELIACAGFEADKQQKKENNPRV